MVRGAFALVADLCYKLTLVEKPIGIFDSGIGGLTVLKEALRFVPEESFIYFGDTARVPYGGKSKETITRFSIENILFLQSFDIKLALVACHTASSLALKDLQERFSLPILGVVEPGARKAQAVTRNGKIGVIGTRATITSGAYESALKDRDRSLQVFSAACPLFVPFVEEGWVEGDIIRDIALFYLEPLKLIGVDTLILGCTHYPLLAGVIQEMMTGSVVLVNPAEETASETRALLERMRIGASRGGRGAEPKFFVSDEPEHFRKQGERFLNQPLRSVVRVPGQAYFRDMEKRYVG